MHLAGLYYHVYNRGFNREPIFANTGNYLFLLQRTQLFLADYPLSMIAYCLMPTHYHFLLRPDEDKVLSRIIQRLFNSAYELLSPISFLRPALDIPYCHHEKWDGSGYPRGLMGEQIPQSARIFALVDV